MLTDFLGKYILQHSFGKNERKDLTISKDLSSVLAKL